MATLYIRDVPADVVAILKDRAAAEGKSLSAYVGTELSRLAERPTNAQVIARIAQRDRSGGPTTDDILTAVTSARR